MRGLHNYASFSLALALFKPDDKSLVGGVKITVATPGTLYWLKKDTLRKIDQADAEALMKKFDLDKQ